MCPWKNSLESQEVKTVLPVRGNPLEIVKLVFIAKWNRWGILSTRLTPEGHPSFKRIDQAQ